MNYKALLLILLSVLIRTSFVSAAEIDSCLSEATRRMHVIDQQDAIESCFLNQSKQMTQNRCYEAVRKVNVLKRQLNMSETLNSICFYQTTDFVDLKSCMNKAQLFKVADDHDEAIFDCYKQFQNSIGRKQCIEVSRKMIYPAKKEYLFSHCQNNP